MQIGPPRTSHECQHAIAKYLSLACILQEEAPDVKAADGMQGDTGQGQAAPVCTAEMLDDKNEKPDPEGVLADEPSTAELQRDNQDAPQGGPPPAALDQNAQVIFAKVCNGSMLWRCRNISTALAGVLDTQVELDACQGSRMVCGLSVLSFKKHVCQGHLPWAIGQDSHKLARAGLEPACGWCICSVSGRACCRTRKVGPDGLVKVRAVSCLKPFRKHPANCF